jgi:nucleotide-binding universal stress UspA family protein
MSDFACLLLPLDASPGSARAADTALWLAERLGATLHVLHATTHPLPAAEALERLRAKGAGRAHVVVHQPSGDPQAAVLEAIQTHRVDLVVMSARGASLQTGADTARALGGVACAVLERTPVPVVLLPSRHRAPLPWTSMLAAASGEPAADEALDAAARMAASLRLRVTVVHIEDGDAQAPALGAYADAPHHEVPKRFEHLVHRGLTRRTAEEAHCVDEVLLRRGDAATVLLAEAAQRHSSVVALGWRGALGAGRAQVFKRLLLEAECALLVVRRPNHAARARLKVGSEIDDG